ncbi:hypothetical protein [Leptolyngbya sp. FACHB-261]|uniref:hypothetical protein n=1 Tax=Leptolyngbya sp. FACHB-261 TaxID=2692806 RepID=UPI0016845032|nr:hypothetical protein [Leptolyngbya sp. FACHB-261]MBD2102078.1 hypothetical protein [Leptolyngbya sp. FACHB-261]
MQELSWLLLAWGAGAMAILGGLMLLGSLVLLLDRLTKSSSEPSSDMLKLLAVALALLLTGLSAFAAFPFPR